MELNPVRAGMVTNAADYRWSSARAHCFGNSDPLLSPDEPVGVPEWEDWLKLGGSDSKIDQLIRDCTFAGRPCGDDDFIRHLEQTTHPRLSPRKRGPKPKTCKAENLYLALEETDNSS